MKDERLGHCADDPIMPTYYQDWPPLRGDYKVGDPLSSVAVVTLASHIDVKGAAIAGPCKTENLGVEKVVANLIANSNIRHLLVCGTESKGHLPGDAILSLHRNGIDDVGRISGSKGAIPFIENLPKEAIFRFQHQVQVTDQRGLVDTEEINRQVKELSLNAEPYPEPPFLVVKRRNLSSRPTASVGDVLFGCGVYLDASAWQVAEETDV